MKLGLGLSRHQFDLEHYRFARQCGCTHLALHLTADSRVPGGHLREAAPVGGYDGSAEPADPDEWWTYESLAPLTEEINAAELQVGAIGQLGPIFPFASRPAGPVKRRWLERLKTIIRQVGGAGIPVLGYDVGLPAAGGRAPGRFARGDAETFGIDPPPEPARGRRRQPAFAAGSGLEECLRELLPVAAEAGVTLAAQVRQPDLYGKMIARSQSSHHALEFRVADVAAAVGNGVYEVLETCLREKRITCLRVGNVRFGPPRLYETFADDGDLDLLRIMRILKRGGYAGMLAPGNGPRMACAAPWHAATAHTFGYLQAALRAAEMAE